MSKPYSVQTLCERWNCTPGVIRRMIRRGELKVFHIGSLTRIAAEEVERWETTGSQGTGESSPSSGTKEAADSAARLARLTRPSLKPNSSSSNVRTLSDFNKDR
jgi:excisionase family DNA binding protein